jgi:hypothetical protein
MLLDEILNPKVVEVYVGASQDIGLRDPNLLSQLKPTGRDVEGFPLYALQIDNDIVFAIKTNQDELLSILVGSIVTDFPIKTKKTIRIHRSWTPEPFRNKGYSTALYDGLPRCGYRLVSDLQLSPESISVWKKLMTKRTVTAYNCTTHQFTDENPLINDDIAFVLEFTGSAPGSLLEDSKTFTI